MEEVPRREKRILAAIVIGLILLGVVAGISLLTAPAQSPDGQHADVAGPQDTPSGSVAAARIEAVDTSQVRLDTNSPVRIRIANTGQIPLSKERIDMKLGRDFFLIGYQERSYTMTYTETIQPASNYTFTMHFTVPSQYSGVPLAGTYKAEANLYVNDVFADTWKGTVVLS
ncbi:MAG: hypothetical protein QMD46_09765 [Methanomicrobiales archaeon]|nr:hypothetical protein [Methanomicrobiales archaeon]MDI6877377.1 hypothetical protein [Methanomicrobiales archaeon]